MQGHPTRTVPSNLTTDKSILSLGLGGELFLGLLDLQNLLHNGLLFHEESSDNSFTDGSSADVSSVSSLDGLLMPVKAGGPVLCGSEVGNL